MISIETGIDQRPKDEDETTRMRSKVSAGIFPSLAGIFPSTSHVTAAILDHVTAGICPSFAGIFPHLRELIGFQRVLEHSRSSRVTQLRQRGESAAAAAPAVDKYARSAAAPELHNAV
ncbi:hypothetical protein J6590_086912 [Homalodisca vitripennis]|nr:hypothetical protein J6590_086912 [Homalodisca vitripennis]